MKYQTIQLKDPLKLSRISAYTIILVSIFILGLFLRFVNLGTAPLTERESQWALQALQIVSPNSIPSVISIGSQPAYVFLTAVSFQLLSASNFTARLIPALFGSLLIFFPVFLSRQFGRWGVLIMSLGLAFDPGLVATSREAGSPILAMTFTLLTIGLLLTKKNYILAGIFAGLALLSGPALINGLLGIGLTVFVLRQALISNGIEITAEENSSYNEVTRSDKKGETNQNVRKQNLRYFLISMILSILVVGTLFFQYPQGLSAWFSTLPDYLSGWIQTSEISSIQILFTLLFYQPLAIFLSILLIIRVSLDWQKNRRPIPTMIQFCMIWLFFSLLLVILYPAHQASDLVWTLIPIWILGAFELKHYLIKCEQNWITLAQTGLIILLAILFWSTLISTNRVAPSPTIPWEIIRMAVLGGILALGILTTLLIGLGWSWKAAKTGLIWGSVIVFSIYSFSNLWSATQLFPNQPKSLWKSQPGSGQVGLFESTLRDISNWTTGFPKHLSIVSSLENPSLLWLLRDYENVHYTTQPILEDLPDVIITHASKEVPEISTSYRGQDFVWWVWQGWQSAIPTPLIDWITHRKAPQVNESIILWVRSDIFLGGTLELQEDISETEME
jgi:hypothetical protein